VSLPEKRKFVETAFDELRPHRREEETFYFRVLKEESLHYSMNDRLIELEEVAANLSMTGLFEPSLS